MIKLRYVVLKGMKMIEFVDEKGVSIDPDRVLSELYHGETKLKRICKTDVSIINENPHYTDITMDWYYIE
jgi:hypothetical protein